MSSIRPKPKIETFSDLIFGLALSIGALTLIGQQPSTFEALVLSLGLYSFSFLILVSVWRSYSSIMSVLPTEKETLINLNIVLLFIVSIEPYLFNLLFSPSAGMFHGVSILYSLDLAAMFLILAFFSNSLADEQRKLVPKNLLRKYRFDRNYDLLNAGVISISIFPFFESVNVVQVSTGNIHYGITLRVFVWFAVLFSGLSKRLWQRNMIPQDDQAVST
jgi:uncharacterized membrane protein